MLRAGMGVCLPAPCLAPLIDRSGSVCFWHDLSACSCGCFLCVCVCLGRCIVLTYCVQLDETISAVQYSMVQHSRVDGPGKCHAGGAGGGVHKGQGALWCTQECFEQTPFSFVADSCSVALLLQVSLLAFVLNMQRQQGSQHCLLRCRRLPV